MLLCDLPFTHKGIYMKATLTILMTLFSYNAFALDGKALYTSKTCATCHGLDGVKPQANIYPSLAGRDVKCLTEQFKAIKDGVRKGGMTVVMKPIVQTVKDAERDAIVKWLASLKSDPKVKNPATSKCKAKS